MIYNQQPIIEVFPPKKLALQIIRNLLPVDLVLLNRTSSSATTPMALHLGKGKARMKDGQTDSGNKDHDTLEGNEIRFGPHDLILPPAGHLGDPIHAASEDGDEGQPDPSGEQLESRRPAQSEGGGGQDVSPAIGPTAVFGDQRPEDDQRDYLPDDPGHHQVVPCVLQGPLVVFGRGGDAAPGALQDEREEVA